MFAHIVLKALRRKQKAERIAQTKRYTVVVLQSLNSLIAIGISNIC